MAGSNLKLFKKTIADRNVLKVPTTKFLLLIQIIKKKFEKNCPTT